MYDNLFNKLKCNMKIQYYKSMLDENKHDMKKTWSILKQPTGKQNDKTSFPLSFSINGQTVTKADGFNDYFFQNRRNNVPIMSPQLNIISNITCQTQFYIVCF